MRRCTAVLSVLLGVDALLLVLHLATSTLAFDISRDYGVAEIFSYAELLAIVLLLVRAGSRPWAVVFGYLLVDDLLRLHEFFGEGLVRLVDDPNRHLVAGVRTEDLGELAIQVAVGIPLLVMLAVHHRRGSPASRRTDRIFALLLVVMTTFAVGVDLIAVTFTSLTLLEDTGELVTLSIITAYACSLAPERPRR